MIYKDVIERPPKLVKHVQVSKNFGLKGGTLIVEIFCLPNGEPTRFTKSRIEYVRS